MTGAPAENRAPVDFLVIGAMKAGTTWVDDMLRTRTPCVLPAATKETFFFDRYWARGLPWYARQFTRTAGGGPVGEVASSYFASEAAAQRVAEVAPRATLLVILREPGARSWSHYQHLIRRAELPPTMSFADACVARPEIVEYSAYTARLRPWRERCGDRLRVFQYEHLVEDPDAFSRALCFAIEAPLHGPSLAPERRHNVAHEPRSYALAKVAMRMSDALHRTGLHRAVTVAKAIGLNRIVERPAPAGATSREAIRHVRRLLSADTAILLEDLDFSLRPELWLDEGHHGTPST